MSARVPAPVYLVLAAILLAVVVHGLIVARPHRCAAGPERLAAAMEARR